MKTILKFGAFLVVLAVLVFSLPAFAGPVVKHEKIVAWDGSGDYTTITEALNAITDASPTNPYRITVRPGIYNEPVTMKSYIDLEGSGPESTTLTANAQITLTAAAGTTSYSVKNITVTTNAASGGPGYSVVYVPDNAAATFQNVTIIMPDNAYYSGLYSSPGGGGAVQFTNSKIILNSGTAAGPDLAIRFYGTLTMVDSLVQMNTQNTNSPLAIHSAIGTLVLKNSDIKMTTPGSAYGVYVGYLQLFNSSISINATDGGGGTYGIFSGDFEIQNAKISVTVTTNPAYTYGISARQGTIINSSVTSPLYGVTATSGSMSINNSTISGATLGIKRGGLGFKISNSLIDGGHDGVAGIDKVVNCVDGNYNPLPNL